LFQLVLNAIRKLYTAVWERYYNICTGFAKVQFLDNPNPQSMPYEPTDYLLIHRFIRPLRLQPSDVVFDIGCGMGRVLCVFAQMKVKKCVGIELSPELAAIATNNAHRLRGRNAKIEVRATDATIADYSEGTFFWLFNPLGRDGIHALLTQIEQSLKKCPRKVRFAYVNPVQEHVFESMPWLRCTARTSPWYTNNRVSYWENK